MNPIIVIQGGLGNQLSQWSFAHTISSPQLFRIDLLKGLGSIEPREFELLSVLENCQHIKKTSKGYAISPRAVFFYHTLDRLWQYKFLRTFAESFGYLREDPRFDQEQSSRFPKHIRYARGYFQKQQNVEKILNDVNSEIIPIVERILPELIKRFGIGPQYSVIHVRRGDYEVAEFSPTVIGTLSDEYFIRGAQNLKSSGLIVLTEDHRDVLDLLDALSPDLVLDKRDTSPWETLALMYGATEFLGSNSSLSWWGARLCAIRGGKVWLPAEWSFWKNIDPVAYHFPSCNIAQVYWKQGNR
jgi:hypothetical protein